MLVVNTEISIADIKPLSIILFHARLSEDIYYLITSHTAMPYLSAVAMDAKII